MTVSITIHDPTPDEARALAVYFGAVVGDATAKYTTEQLEALWHGDATPAKPNGDPVHEVIHGAVRERQEVGTLIPGAERKVEPYIKSADAPDVGRVLDAPAISLDLATGAATRDEYLEGITKRDDSLDAASIFGGQKIPADFKQVVDVPNPPAGAVIAAGQPCAPVPTAVVPSAGGIEIDSKGMPWDTRIHSSTKAKNADNSWRKRKGVAPQTIEVVEAQLKTAMAAPTAMTIPAVPEPGALAGTPVPDFASFMFDVSQWVATKQLTTGDVVAACNSVGIATANLVALRPDLIPAIRVALQTRMKPA